MFLLILLFTHLHQLHVLFAAADRYFLLQKLVESL